MDWFKKHVDTVIVLGGILGSMIWISGRFAKIEQDLAVMKAVMVMQKIMPAELVANSPETKK